MSGRYFSSYDGKTVMADVDVNGNSLELTIEDEKVKAIGNIPVGGGDDSVWTDETFNALADDDGDDILDENDEAIGDEDAETLWATRDGVGFKAERAEADINGNSLELHVNAEGKIDKIGDKYIEGTGEAPVDAYSKEETDALLDNKVDKVSGKGLSTNDYTDADVAIVHKVWVSDDYTLIVDPTKVEIGGRTYDVVRIGNQMWTTKNIDWKFDGLTVGGDYGVTVPAAWYPDDDEATYGWNGAGYGLLYNYYAAVYLRDNNMLPTGWRVPTTNDWSTLVATVSTTGTGSISNNAGLKLKAKSVGGTNDYNFSMLLPGIRQGNGQWIGIGSYVGNLALSGYGVVYENSNSSSNYLNGTPGDTKAGYSLRLVKDVT